MPFGDALGAFMHIEKTAHPVTGAVVIIEPFPPQKLPRQTIELAATRADRKDRATERNMPLQLRPWI